MRLFDFDQNQKGVQFNLHCDGQVYTKKGVSVMLLLELNISNSLLS